MPGPPLSAGSTWVGTLIVMFVYSWQLALVVIVAYLPVIPLFRLLQKGQLRAKRPCKSRRKIDSALRGRRKIHRNQNILDMHDFFSLYGAFMMKHRGLS